jgi:hypothetical protein
MSSIAAPDRPEAAYQGQQGSNLNPDTCWPILAQAGTYTGITTMGYGTNGWNSEDKNGNPFRDTLLAEYLYFYTVRGER